MGKRSTHDNSTVNVPPPKPLENENPKKEDEPETNILPEKQQPSEEADLITDETESDKSSLESNPVSSITIFKEVKLVGQIGEKKVKRKFFWYGNHKLVKPITEIPPRFQLMLAETNAEKARCEGRPIILQQDSNQNSEGTRGSTPFNPEAQCFIPHQPYNGKICTKERFSPFERTDGTTPNANGEMLNTVNGPTVPFNPVHPMYTIHIYSNSTAPTNSTGAPASAMTNACCMHMPNASSSMYGAGTTTVTAPPPIQGPAMYYSSQPYPQQAYPNPQYPPPGFLPTAPSSTLPQSLQYAPCFTYTQSAHFSSATLQQ